MSFGQLIDLSQLPAPDWIDQKNHAEILDEMRRDFLLKNPDLMDEVEYESTLLNRLFENFATRELKLRQSFNYHLNGFTIAYSQGVKLEHLGANNNVERRVIVAGDPNATPPIEPILENDQEYKYRIRLSNTASFFGHETSYQFWGMTMEPSIRDIAVVRPVPGQIEIYLLGREGNGAPSQDALTKLTTYFSSGEWHGICDTISINSAQIINYEINASLTLYPSPNQGISLSAARSRLDAYVLDNHQFGRNITCSAIIAALHVEGVLDVTLNTPAENLIIEPHQVGYCTSITLTVVGEDV